MKNINNKIDSTSYMILIIFISRVLFNGIVFSSLLNLSKNDTILTIIIGTILGLVIIYLISVKNIKDKNINIFILLFICISFIITLNDFINFSSIKYLFETPNILIALLYIVPIIYICNKGINTIGRSSIFMFYISFILFIINSLALINYIDLNNLKPMFTNNISNIIISSIKYVVYIINPIILVNYLPKNNESIKKYNKKLVIAYLLSSLSILVIVFYMTTVYDYNYTLLFNYPIYFMLKKIEYNSISNAENILSLFFIIDYFYTILVYTFLIKKYFNYKKISNIFYIIFIIILTLISVYIKDIKILNYIKEDLYFYISFVFIIYFIFFIKKDD